MQSYDVHMSIVGQPFDARGSGPTATSTGCRTSILMICYIVIIIIMIMIICNTNKYNNNNNKNDIVIRIILV